MRSNLPLRPLSSKGSFKVFSKIEFSCGFFLVSKKPILYYNKGISMTKHHIGSCLHARKIISKGCIYYIVWDRNTYAKSLILEWIPNVNDFPWVFQDDLTHVPPKREINISIELLLNTPPISIAPYHMVLAEFKDLMHKPEDL